MGLSPNGTGKTKAYLNRDRAQDTADQLQAVMPGWTLAVLPSPEKADMWGVRAERFFSDINEDGALPPIDSRRPLMLIESTCSQALAENVGRVQVLWLKLNGLMYLPKENEE
jgi:hypothetical protein